ncbi:LysR family transcriptional regulator [Trinickia symbiotica]|uniref:LysR family transcriptional regulator n=1 Tax=Trinickia symbiotica TaxID=863227 RepID=A0A2N7WL46_9BURK|nr:LysR family transcriptional regulator [Trinickia symbiotica]PMS30143.1 LysR family transcriptional regulator [Trinickia symbiotica]PPK41168.1 LysR family transcriptional regulator [Trinickia symbiotica]
MKIHVLEYFAVLAEELHFGRAASRLSITQPPLSTAIKSLEEELGVMLFRRNKQQVLLTPAGAAFLVEAREILESVARAKNVARSVDKGTRGRLDIGFAGSLVCRGILEIIEKFRQETPEVELVLHEMNSSEQFNRLIRGRLEAGFTYGVAPPPKLKSIPLKDDTYALCLPEHHPKANESVIGLHDLAEESFLMLERDVNPENHDNIISMFSRTGIYPRFLQYTRNWMTSLLMVSKGYGMAIVAASLACTRIDGVRMVPLADPSLPVPAMLTWNPRFDTPSLDRFLASAAQTIQRQTDKSAGLT